jgi:hypothetical protein
MDPLVQFFSVLQEAALPSFGPFMEIKKGQQI